MLHVKQTYLIVEYCKKSNFGQKTKRENGKKRKHRKKTIQVSNFHSAAGTNVNLTGRKQVMIQWGCCLFFDGKTVIIFGKNFKPYKVRFNFSKKRKRFFLLKKILNETRNIAVPEFRKRKGFLFCAQTEREKSPYTFYRKVIGAENGIYSKGVKSVDTRTKFPYN